LSVVPCGWSGQPRIERLSTPENHCVPCVDPHAFATPANRDDPSDVECKVVLATWISFGCSASKVHQAGTGLGEQAERSNPVTGARSGEYLLMPKIATRVFKVVVTFGFHGNKAIDKKADSSTSAAWALSDGVQVQPDEMCTHFPVPKFLRTRVREGERHEAGHER
jgi:hypothetical protein